MIPKELWIRNITQSLKEIASLEFQEKGWIKGEVHGYCTFVETICGLYDSSNFNEFVEEKAKEFGLSYEQINKLEQLRQALDIYVDKHGCYEDPAVIVKDPEWLKIRQMAKETLKELGIEKYLDPSKDILKNSILYTIYWLSDPIDQERVWIKERRPNADPFLDLVEHFFQDVKADQIVAHYKDYEITEEQIQPLKRLYEAFKVYKENGKNTEDLQKILNDPEWHKIQDLAKETVRAFNFVP